MYIQVFLSQITYLFSLQYAVFTSFLMISACYLPPKIGDKMPCPCDVTKFASKCVFLQYIFVKKRTLDRTSDVTHIAIHCRLGPCIILDGCTQV